MAFDVANTIKDYLILDFVDTDPTVIFNMNPGVWSSPSEIPIYMYTSLCTLWTGSSGNVVELEESISPSSGAGKTQARAIWISPYIIEGSVEGSMFPYLQDVDGAESGSIFIGITYNKAEDNSDFNPDVTQNVELRIRLLLDMNLRARSGKTQDIPQLDGGGINKNYPYFLSWKGYSVDPSAIEIVTEYHAAYVRQFGRVIIP